MSSQAWVQFVFGTVWGLSILAIGATRADEGESWWALAHGVAAGAVLVAVVMMARLGDD